MKLAEALQERADLNRKVEQLCSRLKLNALVQEGEKPAEDPSELLKELNGCIERLEELIVMINHANCTVKIDGLTLTQMIARRDALTLKIQSYRQLIFSASSAVQRASHTEIKIISAVNVKELQTETDKLAKELRELDNKIQQTNWTVDI